MFPRFGLAFFVCFVVDGILRARDWLETQVDATFVHNVLSYTSNTMRTHRTAILSHYCRYVTKVTQITVLTTKP